MVESTDLGAVDLALVRVGVAKTIGPDDAWDGDTLLAVYVELAKIRDSAKAWLKHVEAAFHTLEPDVCEYFDKHEKQKDTRRGRTISIAHETWPKIIAEDLESMLPPDASKEAKADVAEVARARLVEALAGDPDTEHLVKSTFNSTTIRSWILNDLPTDPETLLPVIPEHLEGRLGVVEKDRAKVLKA